MALVETTFEGLTDGQTVTVATLATGSGDVPNQVNKGTGSAIIAAGGIASAIGSMHARFDLVASQTTMIIFDGSGVTGAASRWVGRLTAYPDAATRVLEVRNATTTMASMVLDTAGNALIYNNAGGLIWTSGSVVPLNQEIRLDLFAAKGTGLTDGKIKGGFATSATAALATPVTTTTGGTAYSRTDVNAGTTDAVSCRGGKTQATAWAGSELYLKRFGADYAATDTLTPPTAASVPTATLGVSAPHPQSGASITLTGGGTGTISSRQHRVVSGPPGAPGVTFGSPTAAVTTASNLAVGTYVFGYINSGPGGPSTEATVTVNVHTAAGIDVVVVGESGSGAWTTYGTTPSKAAAVSDTSSVTGVESPTNPTGQEQRFLLPPLGLGPIELDVAGFSTGGAITTRTITLCLANGTTTVDSWNQSPVADVDTLGTVSVDPTGIALLTGVNDEASLTLRDALILKIASTL